MQRRSEGNEECRSDVLLGAGRNSLAWFKQTVRVLRYSFRRYAKNVAEGHELWLSTPGKKGQAHKDNTVRIVRLPPHKSLTGWDISPYRDRWDLIERVLKADGSNAEEI